LSKVHTINIANSSTFKYNADYVMRINKIDKILLKERPYFDLILIGDIDIDGNEFHYSPNKITDDCLKYLKNVHTIDLTCSNITNNGLKYLQKVKHINISYCNKITDEGLEYLKNADTIIMYFCENITKDSIKYLNNVRKINSDIEELRKK